MKAKQKMSESEIVAIQHLAHDRRTQQKVSEAVAIEHLAEVAKKPLHEFVQIDGFIDADGLLRGEADHHPELFAGRANEFFNAGWDVRVLFRPGFAPQNVIEILKAAIEWLERDPSLGLFPAVEAKGEDIPKERLRLAFELIHDDFPTESPL